MKERAIIIGISLYQEERRSMDEIIGLTETAGVEIVLTIFQNVKKINSATFIGSGKVEEIKKLVEVHDASLLIIDHELTGSQQSNLEKVLEIQVLDRTALILDIFAQRARTKEGKIQVELAQLNYALTRLKGKGIDMSRLAGGIGTRGPGEAKLETDRRKIREKIIKLGQELTLMEKNRTLHRQYREKKEIPQVSLLGYTNAGKSTLLNLLTESDVLVENKLFATLDPTTRKLKLSGRKHAILTDTVGFIEKLPHHLVKAFKSTFEEIREADLILHVIDASNPVFHEQALVVQQVLESMDITDIPTIYLYNKTDAVELIKALFLKYPKLQPSVMLSAKTGDGVPELMEKIEAMLSVFWTKILIKTNQVPSWLISMLLSSGSINKQEDNDGITIIEAEVPRNVADKIMKIFPDCQIMNK